MSVLSVTVACDVWEEELEPQAEMPTSAAAVSRAAAQRSKRDGRDNGNLQKTTGNISRTNMVRTYRFVSDGMLYALWGIIMTGSMKNPLRSLSAP